MAVEVGVEVQKTIEVEGDFLGDSRGADPGDRQLGIKVDPRREAIRDHRRRRCHRAPFS
jgi:hypothetical protein